MEETDKIVERFLKNNQKFVNSKKGIFWLNVKNFKNIFVAFTIPFICYMSLKQRNKVLGLFGFILAIPVALITSLHKAIISIGSLPLFLFGEAMPLLISKNYHKDFKASLVFKKLNESYKLAKEARTFSETDFGIKIVNDTLNKTILDGIIEVLELNNDEVDKSLDDEDYEKGKLIDVDVLVTYKNSDEQEKTDEQENTNETNQTFDNTEDSENNKTKDNNDGLQL